MVKDEKYWWEDDSEWETWHHKPVSIDDINRLKAIAEMPIPSPIEKIDYKKQFFVFSFSDYYPTGGLGDIRGTFDTLKEAKQAIENGKDDRIYDNDDIDSILIGEAECYIWDRLSGEIVFDLYRK